MRREAIRVSVYPIEKNTVVGLAHLALLRSILAVLLNGIVFLIFVLLTIKSQSTLLAILLGITVLDYFLFGWSMFRQLQCQLSALLHKKNLDVMHFNVWG